MISVIRDLKSWFRDSHPLEHPFDQGQLAELWLRQLVDRRLLHVDRQFGADRVELTTTASECHVCASRSCNVIECAPPPVVKSTASSGPAVLRDGRDIAMAAMVCQSLTVAGYHAIATESLRDFSKALQDFDPVLLLVDDGRDH